MDIRAKILYQGRSNTLSEWSEVLDIDFDILCERARKYEDPENIFMGKTIAGAAEKIKDSNRKRPNNPHKTYLEYLQESKDKDDLLTYLY